MRKQTRSELRLAACSFVARNLSYEDDRNYKALQGLSQLLVKAQRENLLLRSPTGAEFILAEINDFDREIQLQRGNPDLMAFLDRRGRQPATRSASEVRKHLRLAKRAK